MEIKSQLNSNFKFLLSYAKFYKDSYVENTLKILDKFKDFHLMIDSGAYTKKFAKKFKISHINIKDYIAYCHRLEKTPEHIRKRIKYVSLDVIGDEIETEVNLKKMRDAGLNPLPVFTRGGKLKNLEKLLDQNKLILLGGIAKSPNTPEFLHMIDKTFGRKAFEKIHLLGISKPEIIKKYLPYSYDSQAYTSWFDLYRSKSKNQIFKILKLFPSNIIKEGIYVYKVFTNSRKTQDKFIYNALANRLIGIYLSDYSHRRNSRYYFVDTIQNEYLMNDNEKESNIVKNYKFHDYMKNCFKWLNKNPIKENLF